MDHARAQDGEREERLVKPAEDATSAQSYNVGAVGYGLSRTQQKAVADLWAWQEESLRGNAVLGGPIA